jgi:hypothetical protein
VEISCQVRLHHPVLYVTNVWWELLLRMRVQRLVMLNPSFFFRFYEASSTL